MAYPHSFISMRNFELAFSRIVRGQNKEYKNLFRHLYSSYQLGLRDNLYDLIIDIKAGRYQPSPATVIFQPKKSGILRPLRLLTLQDQIIYQAIANVIAVAFKPEQDKHAGKRCFGALVNDKNSLFFYRGWKRSYRAFDRAVAKAFTLFLFTNSLTTICCVRCLSAASRIRKFWSFCSGAWRNGPRITRDRA
jgi:hypothetical protein